MRISTICLADRENIMRNPMYCLSVSQGFPPATGPRPLGNNYLISDKRNLY